MPKPQQLIDWLKVDIRLSCVFCMHTLTIIIGLNYVFASHSKAVDLIGHFISRDVSIATSTGTLFRNNTVSSKMFGTYARMIGLDYLWEVFARPVNELIFKGIHAAPSYMINPKDD